LVRNKKKLRIAYYASFFVFIIILFFSVACTKSYHVGDDSSTSAEDIVRIQYGTYLTGKAAVETGSNSGIGLETARVLSLVGAKVIIPCRTMAKASDTVDTIKQTVSNADLVSYKLD
jgi:hypothetical protein